MVQAICFQTCSRSMVSSCLSSCSEAINSMSATEFFNALQKSTPTVPSQSDLQNRIVDEIKEGLITFYQKILSQSGYYNVGEVFHKLIKQNSPTTSMKKD